VTARSSKSSLVPVVGILLGLALLVGLVGMAVGLPKLAGDSGGHGEVTMPDELAGFTSVRVASPPPGAQVSQEQLAAEQTEFVEYTEESATEELGHAVGFDVYVTEDFTDFFFAVVYDGESALLPTTGFQSQATAEKQGLVKPIQELVAQGDALCDVQWQQVPAGQGKPEDVLPARAVCQKQVDGRTLQVVTSETTLPATVEYLDELASRV